jgi:methylisocitrate lyase
MHLEDQVMAKRCGHRPGKALVTQQEMVDRIKAAVDGRTDDEFVIMARTDAHAVEGQQAAVDRALAYVEAGADMIFAEALATLDEYRQFTNVVKVPVLANITEFGKTPLFTVQELGAAGIGPRAVPAVGVPRHVEGRARGLRRAPPRGHAEGVLDRMQTRTELYEVLGYHEYEQKRRSRRSPWPCPAPPAGNTALCTVAAAATTCITAATTFSMSPTPASSRKSPTCWCTASCRTRPS